MKRNGWLVALAVVALTFTGCLKENESGSDGDGDSGNQLIVCGDYTKICNMVPGLGCASEDAEALYFSVLVDEQLMLVRQDKVTGERLALDTIAKPQEANIDYSFQFICAEGDYVYYMPFDTSVPDEQKKYKIWRVKKDGSEKTMISAPDDVLYDFYILEGRIYYRYLFSSPGVYACALDGSGSVQVMDREMGDPILYEDRFYYMDYIDFPKVSLVSCKQDGTDEQVLLETSNNIRFVIGDDDKIYVTYSGAKGWVVRSMNSDGTDPRILVEDLPSMPYMNTLNGALYLSINTESETYGAGLYKYANGRLTYILQGQILNFALLDEGRIIYMNQGDISCGRLGASYETKIDGTYNKKL